MRLDGDDPDDEHGLRQLCGPMGVLEMKRRRAHAVLEVDSANPTGAARLYRALGFESLHRSVTYQIEVQNPGGGR